MSAKSANESNAGLSEKPNAIIAGVCQPAQGSAPYYSSAGRRSIDTALNYLIDTANAVIIDAEATPARTSIGR